MANHQKPPLLLSVKDLMRIKGTDRYNTARVEHQAIRDALSNGKKKPYLTVREYCEYVSLPYQEIVDFLSGSGQHPIDEIAA